MDIILNLNAQPTTQTSILRDHSVGAGYIGGPYNTLLNRVRSDHSKYSVALRKDQLRSILTISNFSESDVDCEYSCESGLDVARTTLQLNEKDYECKQLYRNFNV